MTGQIDRPSLEPLLARMRDETPDIAAAALAAAIRFPLSEESWRALAAEASDLLDRTDADSPKRANLIAATATIPVRSARMRVRGLVETGTPRERQWAIDALADAGDPDVAWDMIRALGETPFNEWESTFARLARMPIEAANVTMHDLPPMPEFHPEIHFWHALTLARLGSTDALEHVLHGRVEAHGMLHGNPWAAYADIARARPLPEPLRTRILTDFGIADEPDPERVREAGLIVWALTGIADAQGYVIEPTDAETTAQEAESAVAGDSAAAEATAGAILDSFEMLVRREVDVAALAGLPKSAVESFVRELLRAAHRFASREEHAPHYMISNAVLDAIVPLPRTDLPLQALYEDWHGAERPGVDAEQLAWIIARSGAGRAIEALSREPDARALEILAYVGDVSSGIAGSPWRGSGGGSAPARRPDMIEDVGWAESAGSQDTALDAPTGGEPGFRAVLSAEGPKEMDIEQRSAVRVRVEREEGAEPLEHSAIVSVRPEPISVMLFLSNESVVLQGPVLQQVDAPAPGQPREIEFPIVAKSAGETRAIVHFQQGSTTLAMLTFTTRVVASGADAATTGATGSAAARDPFDDGVVRILIQQPTADSPHYTYFVTSKLMGLVNKRYESPAFEEPGSAAKRPKAYAQSIYNRIEEAFLEVKRDARALETRLERIGTGMCARLFPPELVRELWKHRDTIECIEITPVEPYIPWELLRLDHPDHGPDDRFLSEYRLVRVLGGREPSRVLGRAEWRYVLGDYPNQLYADLPGERDFLTNSLPALGVIATPVPSNLDAILEAVDQAEFDVIHFACHGEASLDDIDESALIVADRFSTREQKAVPIKVYPTDMKVNLSPRRPLVFLSACQSGRMAPSLADFGGWPKIFVDAQAGAMVGTSWEVHEKPAIAFAKAFYTSLLRGETLGEAAGEGRKAARALHDASWLAYAVYGWASARMSA